MPMHVEVTHLEVWSLCSLFSMPTQGKGSARLTIIGVGRGGGNGSARPLPHFPGRRGGRRSLPPHFCAHAYLKIPPRSLFFHPHNSTVLTPNQSVRRCFEKFIGVGTGASPHPRVSPVGRGYDHPCWKPLRAFFSVCSNILFCSFSVYQSKNKPWSFPSAGRRVSRILHSLH